MKRQQSAERFVLLSCAPAVQDLRNNGLELERLCVFIQGRCAGQNPATGLSDGSFTSSQGVGNRPGLLITSHFGSRLVRLASLLA